MVKKGIAILLSFAMLLSLCACSSAPSYKGTNEELDGILERISEIPIATMGVSMVITNRAVELLDWCEATTMSADELAANVKAYYDAMDAEAQGMFIEQVAVVVNGVWTLSREESRAAVLETAGFNANLSWDEATMSLAVSIDDLL